MTQAIRDMHCAIDRELFRPNHQAVGRSFVVPTVIYCGDMILHPRNGAALLDLVQLYWRKLLRAGVVFSASRNVSILPLPNLAYQSDALIDFFDQDGQMIGEGEVRFWIQMRDTGPRIELLDYRRLPLGLTGADFAETRCLH